jgi:hypothetical protein
MRHGHVRLLRRAEAGTSTPAPGTRNGMGQAWTMAVHGLKPGIHGDEGGRAPADPLPEGELLPLLLPVKLLSRPRRFLLLAPAAGWLDRGAPVVTPEPLAGAGGRDAPAARRAC